VQRFAAAASSRSEAKFWSLGAYEPSAKPANGTAERKVPWAGAREPSRLPPKLRTYVVGSYTRNIRPSRNPRDRVRVRESRRFMPRPVPGSAWHLFPEHRTLGRARADELGAGDPWSGSPSIAPRNTPPVQSWEHLAIPRSSLYTVRMKRTNLVLDEHLLEELTRVSGERTYSGAVTKAMEDYLRRHKAGRLLELAGSGLWEGDLSEMRRDSLAPERPRR
jgi:Arc/MetJ family transcription regulator